MSTWYYAHGGEQKGPVEASELQRLSTSGEFDPHKDLVWQEGMSDWKPASAVPELKFLTNPEPPPMQPGQSPAGAPAGATTDNPYAAPATANPILEHNTGIDELEEIEPGSEPLAVGQCISRAFELTKKHFGMIIVVGLAYLGVSWVAGMLTGVIEALTGGGIMPNFNIDETTGEFSYEGVEASPLQITVSIFTNIISQVVATFLSLGTTRIGLNIVSGRPFEISMIFGESQKLLRALGAGIVYGLAVTIGLLLLIIPGIYIALRWGQYFSAIVDKDMGAMESLAYSSRITKGQKLNLFLLGILFFFIILAGILALFVGLIFAYPIVWLAGFVAYRWLQYGSASLSLGEQRY